MISHDIGGSLALLQSRSIFCETNLATGLPKSGEVTGKLTACTEKRSN